MAMIEVPDFDGFECVGIKEPREVNDCYVLAADGLDLVKVDEYQDIFSMRTQLCYRKIKPKRITFEFTGEIRPPKCGEFFKTDKSEFHVELAQFDYQSEYEIYQVVEE